MDSPTARSILAAWRPGLPFADEPEVRAALDAARDDPSLATWLAEQRDFHERATRAFRALPVPPDLPESVIARCRVSRPRFRPSVPALLAVAAALVAVLMAVSHWAPEGSDSDLDTYRRRMVRAAMREYRMDIETPDVAAIRSFLVQSQAPGDFELTPALSRLRAVGAGTLSWKGGKAAMVCLDGGTDGMLYLFVVPKQELEGPVPHTLEVARINRLSTGTWVRGENVHVLASSAPEDALRRYL